MVPTRSRGRTAEPRVDVVGSLSVDVNVVDAAPPCAPCAGLRTRQSRSELHALVRVLAENAEALGVLVMVNGVVGSNTAQARSGRVSWLRAR